MNKDELEAIAKVGLCIAEERKSRLVAVSYSCGFTLCDRRDEHVHADENLLRLHCDKIDEQAEKIAECQQIVDDLNIKLAALERAEEPGLVSAYLDTFEKERDFALKIQKILALPRFSWDYGGMEKLGDGVRYISYGDIEKVLWG